MADDNSADIVVVGTGVVGCLIAEQALDAGLSVLMLEAGPRVDRWRIVENYRNLPPSLRLFHWDAPYPPKPWAPHLETREDKEAEQYLQLEGPNARAYLQGYVRYAKVFAPDPQQSAEWNRGAYLVEGAAHCSTCHTPRGFLMQEETGRALSGAQVGPWYAPNVTSDPESGIGSWSKEDLVPYLRTGRLIQKAQAAGSMGEAVEHSFQYLSQADIGAIATYLRSVPPVHNPADGSSRFTAGRMFSELATLRGRDGISSDNGASPTGAELFQGNCASCHAAEGQGSKDGYYPSLFHNSATGARNATDLIAAILYGVDRTVSGRQSFMPGFGGQATDANPLGDRDIAVLGTYVLAHYGPGDTTITEQQVAEARRGGPSSDLLALTRGGLASAAVVVILGAAFFVRRRRKAFA
jgi:mono/diheme cytochrome c family protein